MNLDDIGRTPISATSPAGGDAHYEPAFVQLQGEIDKLSSVTAAAVIDWTRVVDLAGEVLSTLSKDLSAAAYLGVGLAQTRGLDGLALGARVLKDVAVTFWETCAPPKKRVRGRIAAFAWWQEKILAWLRGFEPAEPLSQAQHQALLDDVRALDEALSERLPDFPPMRDLLEVLGRLNVAEAPQPVSSPIADASPSTAAPESRPAAPASAQPAQPLDAQSARASLASAAFDFASLARRETPADPWCWRAARMGAWLKLRGLPPDEGGRTMLPPPEQAVKNALLNLLAQGHNLEAAMAAEEQVMASLFWLDPHRIAAKALAGLGPDYAAAREAVCGEMRFFLSWLPGVDTLSFSDGTPFADAETLAWLASLSAAGDETSGATADSVVNAEVPAKVRAEADARFARHDVAGALDVLGQAARGAVDGPTRLRLKLVQMEMLGRAGHWPVAMSLAEELVAEVERRGLEDWDPELAVEALLAARTVSLGLGGDDGLARAGTYAAQAARIKPSAALHLAG